PTKDQGQKTKRPSSSSIPKRFDSNMGGAQRVLDLAQVLGSAGFDHKVDRDFADPGTRQRARVEDIKDIRAAVSDQRRNLAQRAGLVRHNDAETSQPAGFRQAAVDDFGEDIDVDV